eukprot:GHVO01023221.1.p1 GENE.GHVO01023221.1~~GHVO01023221.1.p1  ORF type:complete len:234 (-),score=23.38 GHVO01023221.1:176-877(-)
MGASFVSLPNMAVGTVGAPMPCFEFKLRTVEDFSIGANPPRGELLMRGPVVSPGYFMRPEETQASIDSDGWFETGDVAELLPDGCLSIIDRVKEMFKLSQGEYVTPSRLEGLYSRSAPIQQICVMGNSNMNHPVAVIHPDPEWAESWHLQNSTSADKFDLGTVCQDPKFEDCLKQNLKNIARQHNLKGFELVDNVVITTEAFSPSNGLLTPTHKLRRKEFEVRFKQCLERKHM